MLAHLAHYSILIVIFATVILSKFFWGFDRKLIVEVLFLVTLLYVGWGIIHHYREHTLEPQIVLEYILIAGIFMVALAMLVNII